MILWVGVGNEHARNIYESEGYKPTETSVSERHGKMIRYQLDLK